ncbi:MAG: hypothetical protein M5U01_22125 [Ardenticatenaceae bacterium]|nr:hypothetical protein [Ardenticatenaceae bacterium]
MTDLPRCDTNEELLQLIEQSGHRYDVIARTIYGLEIVCVRSGGNRQPPIVITAGAHAGEPAGVLAALALIEYLETDHAVYIVPLRDPFAWGGFARCLGMALGEEVVIESHDDAGRLLAGRGTVVYREEENSLLLALIGDLVFVSMRPLPDTSGPRDVERRLNRVMGYKPELVPLLVGKRLCWPSNLTGVEGCDDFDRAFSAFVTHHGVVADLNRQFTFAYPPVEIQCVRDLVDRVRPGLVLDLHEGQGSKYYLWTTDYMRGDENAAIAQAIIGAVVARGSILYSLKELGSRIDPQKARELQEPIPGLIVGPASNPVRQGASFMNYCRRYAPAFSFETGRWKSLKERVEEQLAGAYAGIAEFERLQRENQP